MAIGSSQLFAELRGALGNIVIYKVGDQIRVRGRAGKYKDRKSPEQMAHRSKVKTIAKLYHHLDLQLIIYWKQLTTGTPLSGYNLFMKENIRKITDEGTIADFSLFRISKGVLPLPLQIEAEITPEKKIRIEWEVQSKTGLMGSDSLQLAVYTPAKKDNPKIRIIELPPVSREAGHYEFQLPDTIQNPAHYYAFFKSKYTNDISDSCYLGSQTELPH